MFEDDGLDFDQATIRKVVAHISEINQLSDGDTGLQTKEQIKLGKIVSECCDLIKKREKEALSTLPIFYALSKCKYAELLYKPLGTNWADTDYWATIVNIAKEADKNNAIFQLREGVFYLLHRDLNLSECIKNSNNLLLGEKDFSFAYSYKVTHQSTNLIASEYVLYGPYGNLLINFNDAIVYLLNNRVVIAYGMDATKLHEYQHINDKKFMRIQFNCPYDTRDATSEGSLQKKHTKQLVDGFMASARQLLHPKGKLHISIQQPKQVVPGKWGKKEYQNAYGLPQSALTHQFELVRVMGDIKDRYARKVERSLHQQDGRTEESKAVYFPFLGIGTNHRVNQFVFKLKSDWLEYLTDSGTDSERDDLVGRPQR